MVEKVCRDEKCQKNGRKRPKSDRTENVRKCQERMSAKTFRAKNAMVF